MKKIVFICGFLLISLFAIAQMPFELVTENLNSIDVENPLVTSFTELDENVEWKSLDIYNLKGQLVQFIDIDFLRGLQKNQRNISRYASGLYFMRATKYYGMSVVQKIFMIK